MLNPEQLHQVADTLTTYALVMGKLITRGNAQGENVRELRRELEQAVELAELVRGEASQLEEVDIG